MTPPDQEEIIKNYISAYNSFDLDGMFANLHSEIEFINFDKGEVNLTIIGIDAFKVQAKQAALIFKSRHQKITTIVYKGNLVEVDIHYTGILAKGLPNGLKEGDEIELSGKSVFEFHDGLIIKLVDRS
jgi:hypothetical protein